MFTVGRDDLIPPEAVEKLTFSGSLSIETTLSIEFRRKPRLAGTFFLPLYKFRVHAPEFMNLLRKFYFMRAAARSTRVEILLFDRLGRAVLIPPL